MKVGTEMMRLARVVLTLSVLSTVAFAQTLQGAGSAFGYPLYAKWFESYHKLHPTVKMHYEPSKGAAIDDLIAGKVDFAGTDAPLPEQQLQALKAKFGDIVQIPTVLGAVVPIYRVDGVNAELKFTSAALAGIYLGTITMWDDPAIADANPNVSLPNKKIFVVHRSDASETTYLWTEYLGRVSPEWKSGPGAGMTIKWPVGHGVKGEDGVEDLVIGPTGNYGISDLLSGVANSIGYVQFHYAVEHGLAYGDVQAESGGFVRAASSSLAAAAESSTGNAGGSIEDEPGVGTYSISSLAWFVFPVKMTDGAKAKAMADFARWTLTDGYNAVDTLHYTRLPQPLVERAKAELAKLP